jgi:hypothetical protein
MANAMIPIQTVVVGTAVNAVSFTSIPQGFKDLYVEAYWSCTSTGNGNPMTAGFNSDSTATYSYEGFQLYPGATYVAGGTSQGLDMGLNSGAKTQFTMTRFWVGEYSSTTKWKTVLQRTDLQPSSSFPNIVRGTRYPQTTAVTSMFFWSDSSQSTNIAVGSTFKLWGVSA